MHCVSPSAHYIIAVKNNYRNCRSLVSATGENVVSVVVVAAAILVKKSHTGNGHANNCVIIGTLITNLIAVIAII